ncbi:MAG: sensor domain-containing diguanylate cyclase [Thermoanaerobaculia bacterium]
MIQVHALEIRQLENFLARHKAGLSLTDEVDLDLVLRQILEKAYEFVPAESGSILLDDPSNKLPNRRENELAFIAAFGYLSGELIGQRIAALHGIVGQVYCNGKPHLSVDVDKDEHFYPAIDERLGHKTHSIVAVPIYIGKNVCGVLELINRLEGKNFTARDMTLLEIFAGYTSFVLQNALDAKRSHELAKRDDLTGLFNDRWFHICLTEAVTEARRTGREMVVIFLDLDSFKVVNDSYGHLAGSQMLREVGFVLSRIVHSPPATVARYGGDEFVMILPETPVAEGLALAEQIRVAIKDATFLSRTWGFSMPPLNLRGIVSASIGIAQYLPDPAGGRSIEEDKNDVLRRADGAMYEAKSLGRNKIVMSAAKTQIVDRSS